MNDDDPVHTLAKLQASMNAAEARRLEFMAYYGPLPPLTRRRRIRYAVEGWISGLRIRLADWISPD